MTDATTPAAAPVRRCPACGAVRPPTAQWCLQCYAAFDPPQPALGPQEPVRTRAAAPTGPAADVVTDAEGSPDTDGDPAADRDHHRSSDPTELDARAEQMLAQLTQQTTDRPGGRLRGLTGSRGSKAGLAIGGAVGLTLLLLAAMAVLGALL